VQENPYADSDYKINTFNEYIPTPSAVLPQSGDTNNTERNFVQRRKLLGMRGVVLEVEAQFYGCGP
jgi:hypothetical protein